LYLVLEPDDLPEPAGTDGFPAQLVHNGRSAGVPAHTQALAEKQQVHMFNLPTEVISSSFEPTAQVEGTPDLTAIIKDRSD